MKLNNYLTEANKGALEGTRKYFDDENVYVKKIKRECSQIVSLYKKHDNVLFRGLREGREYCYFIIPRSNRRPTDTPSKIQEDLDDEFESSFGWRARSEGVFCTGSISTARSYNRPTGTAYVIFPKNGFKYIWSPEYKDLFTDVINDFTESGGGEVDEYEIQQEYLKKYSFKHDDEENEQNGKWILYDIFYSEGKDKEADYTIKIINSKYKKINDIDDLRHDFNAIIDFSEEDINNIVVTTSHITLYKNKVRIDLEYKWEPDKTYGEFYDEVADEYRDTLEGHMYSIMQNYQDDGIEDILSDSMYKENEIMIKCSGYYAISEHAWSVACPLLFDGKVFYIF